MSVRNKALTIVTAGMLILLGYYGFYIITGFYQDYKQTKLLAQSREQKKSTQNLPATIDEGTQYQRLSAKITTDPLIQSFIAKDPGKIQVIEFFNYGCFWCERLHPLVNDWLKRKPEEVAFYRVPVIFQKNWEPLAKAYYIVKVLGKSETLDSKFFEAIFKKQMNLSDEKNLSEFFVQHGVSEKEFLDLYKSFAITNEVNNGNNLSNAYQIITSPAIVINSASGSYLLTSAMVDGQEAKVFQVLDDLLAREKQVLNKQN